MFELNNSIYIISKKEETPIKVVIEGHPCPLDSKFCCPRSIMIQNDYEISFVCDGICDRKELFNFIQNIKKEEFK